MTRNTVILRLLCFSIIWTPCSCGKPERQVVLYTSVDSFIAEPIVRDFEKASGIRVVMLGDTEASKTTGLVNRLIAEKASPRCDVFWNSELVRTVILKDQGVLEPYVSPSAAEIPSEFKDKGGFWHGFAARARVIIYNRNLLRDREIPQSLADFADPRWRGRLCMASPMFGTTTAHMAAVINAMGPEPASELFRRMKENEVALVPGNSVVKELVARGEFAAGLTDTDDAWEAIQSGRPVAMLYPDQAGLGTLVIPNSVALVKGARHPAEAKELIDYLLSKAVEKRLAFSPSRNMPVREGVEHPAEVKSIAEIQRMPCDFEQLARKHESSSEILKDAFGL